MRTAHVIFIVFHIFRIIIITFCSDACAFAHFNDLFMLRKDEGIAAAAETFARVILG